MLFHSVNLSNPTYNYSRNLNLTLGSLFLFMLFMNYIFSLINKFFFNQIIQAEIKINVGHATFAQREQSFRYFFLFFNSKGSNF